MDCLNYYISRINKKLINDKHKKEQNYLRIVIEKNIT